MTDTAAVASAANEPSDVNGRHATDRSKRTEGCGGESFPLILGGLSVSLPKRGMLLLWESGVSLSAVAAAWQRGWRVVLQYLIVVTRK